MINAENPLIVQSDRTLLLDVHAPKAEECRNALIPFAVTNPVHGIKPPEINAPRTAKNISHFASVNNVNSFPLCTSTGFLFNFLSCNSGLIISCCC